MESPRLDNVSQYIKQLTQKKDEYLEKGNLKQVQIMMQKIEDLNSIQYIYNSILQVEENEVKILSLEIQQKEQLQEFDQAWDDLYKLEQDRINEAEETIYELHYKEMQQLRTQLTQQQQPKIKYSAEILQKQAHYNQLFKAQQFGQAEQLKQQYEELMNIEQNKWNKLHNEKMENKLNQLTKKQINELQVLRQKLNTQIQQFIINRDAQKQLLIQKQSIQKQELENKHNAECTKYNQQNNKLLLKLQCLN